MPLLKGCFKPSYLVCLTSRTNKYVIIVYVTITSTYLVFRKSTRFNYMPNF